MPFRDFHQAVVQPILLRLIPDKRKDSRQDSEILVPGIPYPYVPVQGSQEESVNLDSVELNLLILPTPGIFANNRRREGHGQDFELPKGFCFHMQSREGKDSSISSLEMQGRPISYGDRRRSVGVPSCTGVPP